MCEIKSIHLVYVQSILYFLKFWAEQMEKCPELHLCYKRLKGLNKKKDSSLLSFSLAYLPTTVRAINNLQVAMHYLHA